ncbi:hypothetical protein L1887_07551 [Cichorium endivia]|nr:hypothetical protein L1887_07551 [Cichorium endivia]
MVWSAQPPASLISPMLQIIGDVRLSSDADSWTSNVAADGGYMVEALRHWIDKKWLNPLAEPFHWIKEIVIKYGNGFLDGVVCMRLKNATRLKRF